MQNVTHLGIYKKHYYDFSMRINNVLQNILTNKNDLIQ